MRLRSNEFASCDRFPWLIDGDLPKTNQSRVAHETGIELCYSFQRRGKLTLVVLSCLMCGSSAPEIGEKSGLFDTSAFPFAHHFESNWQPIRDELLGLEPTVLPVHRRLGHEAYVATLKSKNGWVPSWQVGSDEPNHDWLTYGLCYRSIFPDEAPAKFPFTAGILDQLGAGVIVAAFSLMRRRSFIAPHRHHQLGGDLLTYHLGLKVERGVSFLNVAGQCMAEEEGKSVVFDGSRLHFAVNMSDCDRVILYMEFDRSKL
jgi:aspartyl/asparaginyl beta-hydroxylase (cupin superfamily)